MGELWEGKSTGGCSATCLSQSKLPQVFHQGNTANGLSVETNGFCNYQFSEALLSAGPSSP